MKPASVIFNVILILAGLFFIGRGSQNPTLQSLYHHFFEKSSHGPASSEEKIMVLIQQDLDDLGRKNQLPKGLGELRKVSLISQSKKLSAAFHRYPLSLRTHKDGRYELEIFADEIENGGTVVQYDLADTQSGNTIWELGRTF